MIPILIFLFLLPLTFSFYTLETFEDPKVWLTYLAAAVLFPFLKGLRRVTAIDMAVILGVVTALVSGLVSGNLDQSILGDVKGPMGILMIDSLAVIYFAVRMKFSVEADRKSLFFVLVLGSVPVCIYALFQAAGHDPVSYGDTLSEYGVMRPIGTLGHPIQLASYLVMLFPFAVYYGLRNPVLIPVPFLMTAAIIATQSRGAWVALVAQTVALGVCSWKSGTRRALLLLVLTWVASFVAVAFVADYFQPGLSESLFERLKIALHTGGARAYYWHSAWVIFKSHPWLGVGTDQFRTAFEHVRTADYWIAEPAGSIGKAHNDFLNALATQGILGGLSFLFMAWAIASTSKRLLNRPYLDVTFTLTILVSIVGYYVQNMSGFPSATTGALFMTEVAFLSPGCTARVESAWLKKAWIIAVILACAMFAYNFALLPYKASSCAAAAIKSKGATTRTSLHILDYAAGLQPHNPVYPDLFGQVADRAEQWELAARGYARAAEIHPEEAIYIFKLGTLTGNRKQIELAQLIEPANPVFDYARKQMEIQPMPAAAGKPKESLND